MTDRPIPSLSRKRVNEDIPASYNFANDVPPGVTITTAVTCIATVAPDSAVADGSPEGIVSGAPTIGSDSLTVTQKIKNGTDGAKYFIVFIGNGSDGMVYNGETTLLISDPED